MAQLRVIVPLLVTVCLAAPPENILQGKNLILVPMEVSFDMKLMVPSVMNNISLQLPVYMKTIRNSTGHVTGMEGVSFHVLDWLAKYYGFQ